MCTMLSLLSPSFSTPWPHQAPHPFPLKLWVLVLPFLLLGIPTLPHSHPTLLKYTLFARLAWTRLQTECPFPSSCAPVSILFKAEHGAQSDHSFACLQQSFTEHLLCFCALGIQQRTIQTKINLSGAYNLTGEQTIKINASGNRMWYI